MRTPDLYPVCDDAYPGSGGECFDRPIALIEGGGRSGKGADKKGGGSSNNVRAAIDLRAIPNARLVRHQMARRAPPT
jgi:hypothetical protein